MSAQEKQDRMSRFIALLALDPDKLARYQADPDAEMAAAGLDEEQQAILRNGDFAVICDYLGGSGPRPLNISPIGGGLGGLSDLGD